MSSLRFPFFSFPNSSSSSPTSSLLLSLSAGLGIGITGGLAISHSLITLSVDHPITKFHDFLRSNLNLSSSSPSSPLWASLSLGSGPPDVGNSVVEPKTGALFPPLIGETQKLLGVGVRRKSIVGLKNIDVYAFGVYANDVDLKQMLSEKYELIPESELKTNEQFFTDVMESDIDMTVRLQIVYKRLSIRSVRNAFEDSIGNRFLKFSGEANKELLARFTSQFKDELQLPQGTVIDLSREKGHVLRTKVHGQEVGSIQSELLCQSIFDLYMGENPLDTQAKIDIQLALASRLQQ